MFKIFNVKCFDINRRLDNWIFSNFKNIPKSAIYKYIRKGKIKVNNNIVLPKFKLKINDLIKINDIIKYNNYNPINKINLYKNIDSLIIYEDKYILVLNKPSGMSVHGGTNIKYDLISSLRKIYNKNYELVHRIDKYSSGIILISKNNLILNNLRKQFLNSNIKKKYLILTIGIWNKKNKFISLPILTVRKNNKKISIVNKFGKKSISIFTIKKKFNNMTFLTVKILTGRTHQIRVHSSYLGCPIAMDNLYGNFKQNKMLLSMGLKRIFIHSYKIEFLHPIYNKNIKLIANMDNNLNEFLKKIN